MRILKRPGDDALADFGDHGARGGDIPEFAFEIVRRIPAPELEHHVDALDEHGGAVVVQVPEYLGIRQETARADPEIESPVQHVIEHGHL